MVAMAPDFYKMILIIILSIFRMVLNQNASADLYSRYKSPSSVSAY